MAIGEIQKLPQLQFYDIELEAKEEADEDGTVQTTR
jgi:hypothetical protein